MKSTKRLKTLIAFIGFAALSFVLLHQVPLTAQVSPTDYNSKIERARVLESEIAELESKLVEAQRDWVTISMRLEELERKILDCYHRLDAAEIELEKARIKLNERLREIYVEGRQNALIALFSSDDVSDLLTRYHYAFNIAEQEADFFEELKEKKEAVERTQERLIALRRESALVQRGSDIAVIESLIAEKKRQLAEINASLIASQPPDTVPPVPSEFDPNLVFARPDVNSFVRTGQIMSGYASWYGNEFHGRPTASGEIFDQYSFTCAHKSLPFGTWLMVTYRGRSVIVRVNDRGPFVSGRFLDLSRGAAEAIGFTGVQWVDCEIVVPRTY